MKNKITSFIKKWSKKKRSYVILILVVLILFFSLKPKIDASVLIDTVKEQNLESTVSASGQVVSNTDLSLSFNTAGVVKSMRVKVGDKVKQGVVLAALDSGFTLGSLTSAEAALVGAKAKYQKLVEGASSESINLAQTDLKNAANDLENTKRQQDVLVENAYRKLLSDGLEARSQSSLSGTAPTISGTYNSTEEGSYIIHIYNTGSSPYFSISGLESGTSIINQSTKSPLGMNGLYIEFPSDFSSYATDWIVDVPNKQSSSYLANLNAYNAALQNKTSTVSSAQALVDAKSAQLAVVKATARPFELDLAHSDVLAAEGQVQSARANYENTIIRAPAPGTITQVTMKLGEQAQAHQEVIVLEDVDHLYIEADINEANIIKIKQGQKVTFLIDSFGPETIFHGEVIEVDPGATTVDGIVNYKVKVSILDGSIGIRPGMNADIKILIDEKPKALVVPKLSLVTHNNKTYLRVITDEKHKKYVEREVVTGMTGDGNLVEIKSGVAAGEKIAVLSNKTQ